MLTDPYLPNAWRRTRSANRSPNIAWNPDAVTAGPYTIAYTNDSINRLSLNDSRGTVINYTPNGLNQYTAMSGFTPPAYDANFNLSGYTGWTYIYDADKRLISVTGNGRSAQFVYDGLGRCVKRTIDGVSTVYTYDEWKPIVEWTGAGGFVAWNLYGPGADEILVRNQPSTAGYLYYHLDATGNVVFLLSDNLQGLEKYTYDAFGKPTITGWNGEVRPISNYGNRFLFTGREYLYTLGLYDYRHRHYHPGLGRFIQTDPIGFGGDPMNLYRYCGGNPINHRDPMGLDYASFEAAVPVARAMIQASFSDTRTVSQTLRTGNSLTGMTKTFVPSKMVAILRSGNRFELSKLMSGRLEQTGVNANGSPRYHETEGRELTPTQNKNLAAAIHGHNNVKEKGGIAESGNSKFDKILYKRDVIMERMDQSNQTVWHRRTPVNNGKGYEDKDFPADGTRGRSSSSNSSSSGPNASEVDAAQVDTAVPILAAETTNRGSSNL